MTKQQNQIIITGILITVLMFIILGNIKGAKKKASPVSGAQAQKETPAQRLPPAQVAEPVKAAEDISDQKTLELQKERAKLAWGRNPFSIPKASKEFQKANLVLKGISLGKDKKAFAFINEDIVKKGDTLGNYEVLEIEKNKVLLQKDSQAFYITLPEE